MKKNFTFLFLLLTGLNSQAQSIVGEWNLLEGTYSGVSIANLTGILSITDNPDTVNYEATFNNGTYQGNAASEYTLVGNKFKTCVTGVNLVLNGISFGFNSCGKYYTSLSISLAAFEQWGGIAIGYYDPTFSINGNLLTFTSPDGKTVLKYENANPSADKESKEERSTSLTIYPNPVTGSATFDFTLTKRTLVRLRIFDLKGRLVEVLAASYYPAGEHTVIWQPDFQQTTSPANGTYLCSLELDGESVARRLLVIQK